MVCRITRAVLLAALAVALLAPPAQAAFPGANGDIVFSSNREGFDDAYLLSGGSELRLTTDGGQFPVWSPDGAKLAFVALGTEVWAMNADGSGATGLFDTVYGSEGLSWSPDRTRIAIAGRYEVCEPFCSQNSELELINADGTGHRRLTNTGDVDETDPSWSPDGSRIAYERSGQIRLIDPETGTDIPLLDGASPSWSPDGRKLAFVRFVSGVGNEIFVADADGDGQTRLTTNSVDDDHPAWSPDGTKIVFDSNEGGDYEVFVMGANGADRQALTSDSGTDRTPDWQPLGAFDAYPRPGSATPARVPLVPAYQACTAPNSTHVTPLDSPSCDPPAQESSLLTSSDLGRGSAFARLAAITGNPASPPDEADLGISLSATDVVRRSDGADYAGQVTLALSARITDKNSGFGGAPATVSDTTLSFPVDCVATPGVAGATCTLTTTAETLVPGLFVERKRSIISARAIRLLDGDRRTYLEEGVLAP
jgi:hypothetical protein